MLQSERRRSRRSDPACYGLSFPTHPLFAAHASLGRGWSSMAIRCGGWGVTCRVVVVATLVGSAAQPPNPINARIAKPNVAFMLPFISDSKRKSEFLKRQETLSKITLLGATTPPSALLRFPLT